MMKYLESYGNFEIEIVLSNQYNMVLSMYTVHIQAHTCGIFFPKHLVGDIGLK